MPTYVIGTNVEYFNDDVIEAAMISNIQLLKHQHRRLPVDITAARIDASAYENQADCAMVFFYYTRFEDAYLHFDMLKQYLVDPKKPKGNKYFYRILLIF